MTSQRNSLIIMVLCFVAITLTGLSGCAIKSSEPADWLINASAYQARIITKDAGEIGFENGLVRRIFRQAPNAATVSLDNLITGSPVIRAIKPEAMIVLNGDTLFAGGLTGQANHAYLLPEWVDSMTPISGSMVFTGYETGSIQPRLEWKQVRHHAPDVQWPPKGVHLQMHYRMSAEWAKYDGITLNVHYNCYDGVPLFSKWIEIENNSSDPVMLDGFISEMLAAVEPESWVEGDGDGMPVPNIQVETDYAFHGMVPANVIPHSVFWEVDPDYKTQVNYAYQTPCFLQVKPEIGPAQMIEPGSTFTSFRTWVLLNDNNDKDRHQLAQRKMYRIIAPWVTENPLMMHIRYSDPEGVKLALDQCAEVGFEMAILTFGSGFNIENEDPVYLKEIKDMVDYAHQKGIQLGGYSLLSSRWISEEDDVINPATGTRGGVIHGSAPCLGSIWGADYMRKLYNFYSLTGMDLLEHDGSYPGHICASTTHPGHRGTDDSQWAQWKTITDFYAWCRAKGIYLNVPDWFYLNGSNKNGMGYREVNWSLPREQQVIHTRQNIFDGTRFKTPSMGWMFVPLTEYHGGGEAATIEPLNEHLDHYQMMLAGNLGNGVQACYRGPRLYDTDSTRELVKKWVDFYKTNREILESDVIHASSRRADGVNPDWMLHANPALEIKGIAVVFNPRKAKVETEIPLNLYYCGLNTSARIRVDEGSWHRYRLSNNGSVSVPVMLPAEGYSIILIKD